MIQFFYSWQHLPALACAGEFPLVLGIHSFIHPHLLVCLHLRDFTHLCLHLPDLRPPHCLSAQLRTPIEWCLPLTALFLSGLFCWPDLGCYPKQCIVVRPVRGYQFAHRSHQSEQFIVCHNKTLCPDSYISTGHSYTVTESSTRLSREILMSGHFLEKFGWSMAWASPIITVFNG